jgi:2-oxo-4-hydroxy-4-carboxy--5-ureidoimidazoline (OHCU) decarboxylase
MSQSNSCLDSRQPLRERSGRWRVEMQQLNQMDSADFVACFQRLTQLPLWVAERVSACRPFLSHQALLGAAATAVRCAPQEDRLALLSNPPSFLKANTHTSRRIAARQTQASITYVRSTTKDASASLSQKYLENFGFPFIFAFRQEDGSDMMEPHLLLRLDNSLSDEIEVAVNELLKGVGFRLDQRVDDQAHDGT